MYEDDQFRLSCYLIYEGLPKAIGDIIDDATLVMVTLNELSSSWESFVQSICGREQLPKFERLWANCVQEGARVLSKNSLQKPHDEENQALAAHVRKGKGRRNFTKRNASGRSTPNQEQKDKHISKVKCFSCHKFVHFAYQYPQKKRETRMHQ